MARNQHLVFSGGVLLLVVSRVLGLKVVGELLEGVVDVLGVGPEIGAEVGVRLGDGVPRGVDEVTEGLSATTRRGVGVLDTGGRQELARSAGSNETRTTRGGDAAEANRTALARDLQIA